MKADIYRSEYYAVIRYSLSMLPLIYTRRYSKGLTWFSTSHKLLSIAVSGYFPGDANERDYLIQWKYWWMSNIGRIILA